MGKTNMIMMLALMLLANGVMAANVQAKKDGVMRRESLMSSLAMKLDGDMSENNAASGWQINPTGEMMESSDLRSGFDDHRAKDNTTQDVITAYDLRGGLDDQRAKDNTTQHDPALTEGTEYFNCGSSHEGLAGNEVLYEVHLSSVKHIASSCGEFCAIMGLDCARQWDDAGFGACTRLGSFVGGCGFSGWNNYMCVCEQTAQAPNNGGGHNVHSTTINCMHKLACYTLMKDRSPSFKCACILGIPVADAADQTICADWIACLEDRSQAEAFVAEAIEVLYRLRSPFMSAPTSLLLQQTSGRQSTVENDHPDCMHPDTTNEAELNCPCWDDMQAQCTGKEGNDLYECLRKQLCASPNVCHSWKQTDDPTSEGQCQPGEISGTTASLAVQDNQRAERAVLADIFHERRQLPENKSSFDSAVELERSLNGKACARSSR